MFQAASPVHRINPDGTLGDEEKQAAALEFGIFAHQIRLTPSVRAVILATRGNDSAAGKPEDPGALKIFSFTEDQLTNRASVAPGGGYGFGPRHLDFHSTQPWVYVWLERQNKLCVFRLQNDDLDMQPMFSRDTLAQPANVRPRPLGGTVHVHPNGRSVYVAYRSDATATFKADRPLSAARTALPSSPSMPARASRRSSRAWTRTASIRAPSPSTRAGAC
jgi:6-phosphogluconolactonase